MLKFKAKPMRQVAETTQRLADARRRLDKENEKALRAAGVFADRFCGFLNSLYPRKNGKN